ncbi:DUF4930 family protein [Macrococcus equipercicus]|nr:DUF4930 family protein [Macrococcus equipercicus]
MRFSLRMFMGLIRTVVLSAIVAAVVLVIMFKGHMGLWGNEETAQADHLVQNGINYSLEDNKLFRNIPLTQVKNIFNFMDKQEFMAVSGLSRIGYNDDYLIAERGSDYLLYRFGDKNITLFQSEQDLQNQLKALGQQISLQEKSAYQ